MAGARDRVTSAQQPLDSPSTGLAAAIRAIEAMSYGTGDSVPPAPLP